MDGITTTRLIFKPDKFMKFLEQAALSEFNSWPKDIQKMCVEEYGRLELRDALPNQLRQTEQRICLHGKTAGSLSNHCAPWTDDLLLELYEDFDRAGAWTVQLGNYLSKKYGRTCKAIRNKWDEGYSKWKSS